MTSPIDDARTAIASASRDGADVTVVRTGSVTVIAITSRVNSASGDLLPLAEVARRASTSLRVVRDAIRAGDVRAFGRQRDRAVRRADVELWIESRAAKPIAGGDVDDDDIAARVRRIERTRRAANDTPTRKGSEDGNHTELDRSDAGT